MTILLLPLALWGLGFILFFRIPVCQIDAKRRQYPTLSVIVPARNEERNLPTLLASLAGQDLSPTEVIVVDDNSTDSTALVAGRITERTQPMTQHETSLREIAHRAMIERGLEPDFPPDAIHQVNGITGPARDTSRSIRDLRDRLWCSIDNDTSRDLDQLTVAAEFERPVASPTVARQMVGLTG